MRKFRNDMYLTSEPGNSHWESLHEQVVFAAASPIFLEAVVAAEERWNPGPCDWKLWTGYKKQVDQATEFIPKPRSKWPLLWA